MAGIAGARNANKIIEENTAKHKKENITAEKNACDITGVKTAKNITKVQNIARPKTAEIRNIVSNIPLKSKPRTP